MSGKKLDISIIIPIYNAEKYISSCLDSILNIDSLSIEVILINDGSNDDSAFICENYMNKDTRVILKTQENKGVSSARNYGISIAEGKYLWFVDADDKIDESITSQLCELFDSEVDLIQFGYRSFGTSGELKNVKCENELLFTSSSSYLNSNEVIYSIWRSLFRREIIQSKDLKFIEGLRYGEDLLFSIEFFLNSNSVKIISGYGYWYRVHQESAMNKFHSTDDVLDHLTIVNRLLAIVERSDELNDSVKRFLGSRVVKLLTTMIAFSALSKGNVDLKIIQREFNKFYDSNIVSSSLNNLRSNLRIRSFRVSIVPFFMVFRFLRMIGRYS